MRWLFLGQSLQEVAVNAINLSPQNAVNKVVFAAL